MPVGSEQLRTPCQLRRRAGLGAEMTRIGAGSSRLRPSKRDRRFVYPAWSQNLLLVHMELNRGDGSLGTFLGARPRRPTWSLGFFTPAGAA